MGEWYTDEEMEELDESIPLWDWKCDRCYKTIWTTEADMPDGWKKLYPVGGGWDDTFCDECVGDMGYD